MVDVIGKNVSVVLQHDIKNFSVDAVEQIIQWGLSEGYTFLLLIPSITLATTCDVLVEERGFRYCDWNVSSGDAGGTTSTSQVVANVIAVFLTYCVTRTTWKSYKICCFSSLCSYNTIHLVKICKICIYTLIYLCIIM